MRNLLILLLSWLCSSSILAQTSYNFWEDIEEQQLEASLQATRSLSPQHYRMLSLDLESMKNILATAPLENASVATSEKLRVVLPLPDGSTEVFEVVESPVMMPGLAAKFPRIKSYVGRGVRDQSHHLRFATSRKDFRASIRTSKGTVYIDPYSDASTDYYMAYFTKDYQPNLSDIPALSCGTKMEDIVDFENPTPSTTTVSSRNSEPVDMRHYRLALACTGEYGASHGGNVEDVLASMNVALNRINQIFELEVSLRFMLIENNDALVFVSPQGDPFINANVGGALLDQNQNVVNQIIGPANYDLGHIFTNGCTDVGGVAGGVICSDGKARGVTCHFTSDVEFIAVEVMAHEIAHQFSVGHSWNNCPGSDGQHASNSAYEPGSGSTIMSYSGACGSQNVQFRSDDYYNVGSLETFIGFSREGLGATCGTSEVTTNTKPKISINQEEGFYIPISTPFELEGSAIDAEGDALTYTWEQFDLGPYAPMEAPILNAPLFRSFYPSADGYKRIFPQLPTILSNTSDITETLPTYSRDLTFRLTARDNNLVGGGVSWAEIAFKSTENAGPFLVVHPNDETVEWVAGTNVEVKWDAANTKNSLVNCQAVDIFLSTDGGFTYPIQLATAVYNDSSAIISVPNIEANAARVKIKGHNNVFFDISNRNFRIMPANTPNYTVGLSSGFQQICQSEMAEANIQTESILGYDSLINIEILGGLPEGAVAVLSSDGLLPGESGTISIDFSQVEIDVKQTFNLLLRMTAPSADTTHRTFSVVVVNDDLSALAQVEPVNGLTDVEGFTDFSWMPSPNATTYDLQVATSLTFNENTLIENLTGLTETSFTPTFPFEENTTYYWRVRANNADCGPGEFTSAFAFRTVNAACSPLVSPDVPINLPGAVTTVTASLPITTGGTVSDLNIPILQGTYPGVNGLRMTLVSPAGTRAVLFDQNCGLTNAFNMGFDDQAASEILCPPTIGTIYTPIEPLSIFNGEDLQGTWIMEVQILDPGFGGGGALEQWELEFCANLMPNAPFVVNNETFRLPPETRSQIPTETLLAEDIDNTSSEIYYTIVSPTTNGRLYLGDNPLSVGSRFRQVDINANLISYQHENAAVLEDSFTFTLDDQEGGWFGTPSFNIVIDEDATVHTIDVKLEKNISLYPNPTKDMLYIALQNPMREALLISVYNVQGQLVLEDVLSSLTSVHRLNTATLANGVYMVRLQSERGIATKKVSIQK